MQDLRNDKTKNIEDGGKLPSKWIIFTSVISKSLLIGNLWLLKFKNKEYLLQYYGLITIIIILVLMFPTEIGTFLGDRAWGFWFNLTKNFK